MIQTRRLKPGETALYKQLRLTALQDAPYAFATTYAAAIERDEESWRAQVEGAALGGDRAIFISFDETTPVGMAALYRQEGHTGELLQVWVHPAQRGSSAARELIDAVFAWARENNFHSIQAVVAEGNSRALQFYARYGFIEDPSARPTPGETHLVKNVD